MDTIRALVNEDIEKIEQELYKIIETNTSIHNDIKTFINSSSKRIRSLLCILYLKANSINISENLIKLIAASELIHNASLLHDDVIDDSEQRRGNLSFYKKYNPKMAILSGDYLLSIAVKYLLEINNSDILEIFLNTTEQMSNAELRQYSFRNKKINLDEYIKIINGKTASLFIASLESAAILSGIERYNARNFGKLYGELFQINNDTKQDSIINDKRNGINTIIDIIGIEKTQILKDNYKEQLREIIKLLPNNEYSEGLGALVEIL